MNRDMFIFRRERNGECEYYVGGTLWTEDSRKAARYMDSELIHSVGAEIGCRTVIHSMQIASDDPDLEREIPFNIASHVSDDLNGAKIQRFLRSLKLSHYASGGCLVVYAPETGFQEAMDLCRLEGIPAGRRWDTLTLEIGSRR